MELIQAYFFKLNPAAQVKFLREGKNKDFAALGREGKVDFIKEVLKEELSSKAVACAIKTLRRLNYNDRFFYRKFLYHLDSAVANAAKKAIKECSVRKDSRVLKVMKMFQEGKTEDRVLIAKYILKGEGKINENMIVALLSIDDQRMRAVLTRGITPEHKLDDRKLAEAISGGGTVWYTRAALVTILGNRKSEFLLDAAQTLVLDQNVEVRLSLIEALSKMSLEQVSPFLQKLTHDPLVWVRKKAHQAIAQLRTRESA